MRLHTICIDDDGNYVTHDQFGVLQNFTKLLYMFSLNTNDMSNDQLYIQVSDKIHRIIFDDLYRTTLQHICINSYKIKPLNKLNNINQLD